MQLFLCLPIREDKPIVHLFTGQRDNNGDDYDIQRGQT